MGDSDQDRAEALNAVNWRGLIDPRFKLIPFATLLDGSGVIAYLDYYDRPWGCATSMVEIKPEELVLSAERLATLVRLRIVCANEDLAELINRKNTERW